MFAKAATQLFHRASEAHFRGCLRRSKGPPHIFHALPLKETEEDGGSIGLGQLLERFEEQWLDLFELGFG
jgi:hypothetical protein